MTKPDDSPRSTTEADGEVDHADVAVEPWVLDRPQITTKAEWRKWMRDVQCAPERPRRLTRRQRASLDPAARDAYDAARIDYHSRFGPVRHVDFQEIHDEVLELADTTGSHAARPRGLLSSSMARSPSARPRWRYT